MADQALNGLKVKTDSLPNDWYVSLINPKSGEPAEIMTVAKFVELFTAKQPEATESSKGLMSSQNLKSNPSSYRVNRKYINISMEAGKAYRIRIRRSNDINFSIKLRSNWTNGMSHGVLEKTISYGNGSSKESIVNTCNNTICAVYYISNPYPDGDTVCVDVINKANGNNSPVIMLESYRDFSSFEFIENQTPRTDDLTKNNRNESEFALKVDLNTLAASQNALTDTISDNYSILPPPPQIACQTTQNQPVQRSNLRYPLCRKQTTWMVQLQLIQNRRNSMSGQLTRSEKLSWNYRKKTRDLNKSSISLTIARYNKCNLPRAGPPRLIN